jgi:transposase
VSPRPIVMRAAAGWPDHGRAREAQPPRRELKLEREIISKAAAWFARETDVIPPKGSNS